MRPDNRTRKQLRAIGHRLNPVVIVSNGLSAAVLAEINRALDDHELIKVRVNAGDRVEKQALIAELCKQTGAENIQTSGHIVLLLRRAARPKAELSNLERHRELLAD